MGTTSEELKKLYAKLGGKDPKVAGFSAPGEILNAINEIPLPTEYELPTVTTEDAGDVLVVNEEGKWDKGEAGGGLPEVTADDNGDILQVIEGAWAKAAMSKDVVVYNLTASSGSNYLLDSDKNVGMVVDDVNAGKAVFLEYYDHYAIISEKGTFLSSYVFTDIRAGSANGSQIIRALKFRPVDNTRTSRVFTCVENFQVTSLPAPSSAENGKILSVVNSVYSLVNPPASLPEVTAADNGDILQVVNGAWAKAKPETVVIEGIKYNDAAKLDMTQKEVADLVFAGQDVVLKLHPETDPNSFYYLRLVDVTDKIHFYNITRSPQATNYLWVDVSPTSTSDRATLNSMTVGD